MCGISGFTGPSQPDIMEQMLTRIQHRGPDDRGVYANEKISLGMVRLSIIDLKGGHQPMCNEDSTVWVVFNGEIYNFVELREELKSKGHIFKTQSDTETIVHGYEEYGAEVGHKLNGMFAIAIWDVKKQCLTLIRDRYGVKPLFYSANAKGLVFGSEIKALLCHPGVSTDLEDESIAHYLSLRNVPAPLTVYKGIRMLLPGHRLVWDATGAKVSRWYHLPTETRFKDSDEESLIDQIDSILSDSVRLRLRSDVSYGAYLSGGIDSSTVVGIMSKFTRNPIKTFCLSFADNPVHKKDSYYARLIAQRYGTEHHEYSMDCKELEKEILHVVDHLDQPFSGVVSSFWLSRFIRQHVIVALSGDGADDIFGSYGHHRLVWPIAAIQAANRTNGDLSKVDFGFFRGKEEWVSGLAKMAPWEWRLAYGAFTQDEKADLLSKEGRERFVPYSTAGFLQKIYEQTSDKVDLLNRMLHLDINTLLPNEILYYSDMLSMAHSIEVRTPFLDYRMVELAAGIPGTLKIRNGILKYIFRRVAARYVPKEVLDRPKEGFVLPNNSWLREGLSPMLGDVLQEDRLAIHGLLNARAVASLKSRFLSGDESVTFKIWTLMMFQLWYEQRVEAKTCLK